MFASTSQDEIPPPPPPPPSSQTPTQQIPHTVSTSMLPISKKGEYDIWAMKMVALFGPYRLSNLGEDHLAKFHKMTDAKEMWDAIKSRFGGNDESKKMQKYILKQQFEGFSVSNTEGLHKGSTASSPQAYKISFVSEKSPASTNEFCPPSWIMRGLGTDCEYDLKKMDLKWQWPDLNENEKFYKKTGYRDAGILETRVGSRYGHKGWDSKALDQTQSDASIEIKAYSQGLKKVEAQLVAHQQGQLWYEQKIKFMKIDLDDKTDVLTYHKKLLAEAQKEKEDLKAKVEKWHNSSKNLSKLLNTQMSANDKFGLGYGDHRYDGILSYENEVLQSVFMNKESEIENQPLYDRFVTAEGMHAVPPPMTGNYMPSGPDVEIDDSKFTYGPKQTQPSESESQSSEFDTCESNISAEPSELVSEPVVNESNVECQPKVWSDAPIIEEYESDSEDECVSIPTKQQETPSFANKQVKTPRENVKSHFTHNQKPKVDKKDLGYGFTVRACFVCGSFNHLIRDCDFHEKRMARKADLNNGWKNVQRVNKQNQFVPSAVLTRTGKIPVNTAKASSTKNFSTARQSFNRQTVLTSTAMKVNTVSIPVSTASPYEGLSFFDPTNPKEDDSEITPLEDIYQNTTYGIFTTSSYDDEGAVADFTNLETVVNVSPIPTSRIHSSYPTALILGDPTSAVQTRRKLHKSSGAHAFVSYVQKQRRNNHKDFQHCLFACFLSQHEPKKISEALEDESWVDVMQEELLQFEIHKVWILIDLPFRKKAIGTKWVYRNKKDERGVVVRNKARLVAQGHSVTTPKIR
ncbi:ribonuclease H-like domain-containing protein [Tanacetum coccineum]